MACNLLVIVTYFDNVRRRRAESQALDAPMTRENSETGIFTSSLHSNEAHPSEMLSTLVLTEISDASAYNPDDRISIATPMSSSPLDCNRIVP